MFIYVEGMLLFGVVFPMEVSLKAAEIEGRGCKGCDEVSGGVIGEAVS